MKTKLIITLAFACLAGISYAAPDVVFRAMADELHRTMDSLTIEGMSKPYFAAYRVSDNESVTIEGEDGALTKTSHTKNRYLTMEVRVGSMARDNGWFAGSYTDLYNPPRNLPVEDEYSTLRHHLWLGTDKAYKNAQENLGKKNSYYQSHPGTDSLADYTTADTTVLMQEPVTLTADTKQWEENIRAICNTVKQHAGVNEWRASYSCNMVNKRYLNSEQSKTLTGVQIQSLEISATAQATDGQRLVAFRRFYARDNDNLPSRAELLKSVNEMVNELEAMAGANSLSEYSGPIVFTDDAAAQLLSQVFLYNLTPNRKLIATDDDIEQRCPAGKYAQRLNRRVLPDFMTVSDDPLSQKWHNTNLIGYRLADDEGVKPQKLTLVENGKLVSLPTTRVPMKKIPKSNGHARLLANQWIVPSVSNIFVNAKGEVSYENLIEKLRTMCRESGTEYGILVKQLSDPQLAETYSWADMNFNSEKQLLTAPTIMYKVYEKDGRLEPVRGLQFDEVSIRSLRDISAVGNDEVLHNFYQPTVFFTPTMVSMVSPSYLIDEMELKALQEQEPMYKSARPVAAK